MPKLSYSGRLSISTNGDGTIPSSESDKLHALLDDVISAYEEDNVTLRSAVVHFERDGDIDDMPRAHVDVEANGTLNELATVEENLAQEVVNIGFEPDVSTAKEKISVS